MPVAQAPRRSEFAAPDLTHEILDRGRLAHLTTLSPEGELESRPMNYARLGDVLYFHTAPKARLNARAQCRALAAVEDTVTWLPSTWRHASLACPATTYYRSVLVEGSLEEVTDLDLKAEVLEAFMRRYQPEGGYVPLSDERYRGPLQALGVLALPIRAQGCKVKMGQHLTAAQRQTVYGKLVERGDLECAREMLRANPDLQSSADGWVDDPVRIPAEGVWGLLSSTYWAHKRSLEICRSNLAEAELNLAWMEAGQVIAYCRVNFVATETAWLFDVVVDPQRRGQGLGQRLMTRLLAHPRMQKARRTFLDTRDAEALYEKFGFRLLEHNPDVPRSFMVRGPI